MASGTTQIVWSAAAVEAERLAVGRVIEAMPEAARERLEACVEAQLGGADHSFIARFFFALEALRLQAVCGGLAPGQLVKVSDLAHKLLNLSGIKPSTSRVSYLYGELHEALSRVAAADGAHWEALVSYQRAQLLARKAAGASRSMQLVTTARHLLALGHAGQALGLLAMAAAADGVNPAIGALRVAALRLAGRHEEALTELRTVYPEDSLDRQWETVWTELSRSGDFGPVAVVLRTDRARRLAGRHLDAWLWLKACSAADAAVGLLPSPAQIRRNHQQSAASTPVDAAAYQSAQTLEQLYDTERPLEQRMALVTELLGSAGRCATFERRLLVLAACARWLVRFNQMDLAVCVLAEYRALCGMATAGRSGDVLHLLTDLDPERLLTRYGRQTAPATASPESFRQGHLTRFADLSRLALQVSAMMLKGRIQRMFLSSRTRERHQIKGEAEIAALIGGFLQKRKGVLLKMGQICSYFLGPISAHVKEQLEVLQADVAAMPADMAREVFKEEFGVTPEAAFAVFNPEPFAAGSIGQVHRATTKDGREVAVKIQYPNVRQLIEIELKLARMGKVLFSRLLPAASYEALIAEVKTRLLAETDYAEERRNQLFFREFFASDPEVVIPAPVDAWCSGRVFTAEYIDGRDFNTFAAQAGQAERDRAAAVLMRVALRSNYQAGAINADPQPGNFLFLDGKVAFVDFGCVKRYTPAAADALVRLHRAFFRGDRPGLVEAYLDAGFHPRGLPLDPEEVVGIFSVLNQFARRDEPFTFTPEYASQVFNSFTRDNPHRERFQLPVELFFSSRIDFGLTSVISSLGARVNYRPIMMEAVFPDGDWPAPEAALSRSEVGDRTPLGA